MNVRGLKTKDVFKVATILGKMSKSTVKQITNETNEQALGFMFFTSAFEVAETDIKSWLASLVDMSPAEFDDQDFEFGLGIIEELAEREDIRNFFQRVKALRTKFNGSQPLT